jgi:hypothetical protein
MHRAGTVCREGLLRSGDRAQNQSERATSFDLPIRSHEQKRPRVLILPPFRLQWSAGNCSLLRNRGVSYVAPRLYPWYKRHNLAEQVTGSTSEVLSTRRPGAGRLPRLREPVREWSEAGATPPATGRVATRFRDGTSVFSWLAFVTSGAAAVKPPRVCASARKLRVRKGVLCGAVGVPHGAATFALPRLVSLAPTRPALSPRSLATHAML